MSQRRMKRGDEISGKKKMVTTVCKNSKEEEGKNESMIREKYWTKNKKLLFSYRY